MNNENEIAKICELLNGVIAYGVNEQVCGTRWKKSQVGNRSIAKVLFNAGIGDKKQAVKEFAEKLKSSAHRWRVVDGNGYYILYDSDIDNLITELYGADE